MDRQLRVAVITVVILVIGAVGGAIGGGAAEPTSADASVEFAGEGPLIATTDTEATITHTVTDVTATESVTFEVTVPEAYRAGGSGSVTVDSTTIVNGTEAPRGSGTFDYDAGSGVITVPVEGRDPDVDTEYTLTVEILLTHPAEPGGYEVSAGVDNGGAGSVSEGVPITVEALDIEHPREMPMGASVAVDGLLADEQYLLRSELNGATSTVVADSDGTAIVDTSAADIMAATYSLDGPGLATPDVGEELVRGDSGTFAVVEEQVTAEIPAPEVTNVGEETAASLEVELTPPREPSPEQGVPPVALHISSAELAPEEVFAIVAGEPIGGTGVDRDAAIVSEAAVKDGETGGVVGESDVEVALLETDDGLDGVVVFGVQSPATVPLSFAGVESGDYDFLVDVVRTEGVTDTASIGVNDAAVDGELTYLGEDSVPAGDFTAVEVTFDAATEGYVVIGGGRESNFVDVLHVTDGTQFVINTRVVGAAVSESTAYAVDEGSLTSYAHGTHAGAETDPATVPEFAGLEFVDSSGDEMATTLAEFRSETGLGDRVQPRPLQPARYELSIGADPTVRADSSGAAEHGAAVDRANLLVTPPAIEDITTHTAPGETIAQMEDPGDIAAVTERVSESERVAHGDMIVAEIEATGLYGALTAISDNSEQSAHQTEGIPADAMAELLAADEGVTMTVEQQATGPNVEPATIDFDAVGGDSVRLVPANSDGSIDDVYTYDRFYLLIDSDAVTTFDERGSDEPISVEIELAYDTHEPRYEYAAPLGNDEQPRPFTPQSAMDPTLEERYPYLADDASERETATVQIEPPSVSYDHTTAAGNVLIDTREELTVGGQTNLAPASEVAIEFVSPTSGARIAETASAEVEDNGEFAFEPALDGLVEGEEVLLEAYTDSKFRTDNTATVVSNVNTATRFVLADSPDAITVREGALIPEAALTTAVENTGDAEGRAGVTFRAADGNLTGRSTTVVGSGETVASDLGPIQQSLAPGEYEYTIATANDETTGLLTVLPATAGGLEIESLAPETQPFPDDEAAQYTVTLSNTGEESVTESIELVVEESEVQVTESVSLAGGAVETVDMELDVSPLSPGEHTVTAVAGDETATAMLGEPSADGGDGGEENQADDSDPEGDDDDETSVRDMLSELLGIFGAVGRAHAIGGAVIVGGAYVLGGLV